MEQQGSSSASIIAVKRKKLRKRARRESSSRSPHRQGGYESTATATTPAATAAAAASGINTGETRGSIGALTTLGVCPSVSSRYVKVGNRVGEGSYGVVYQALDKVTNQHVALKRCLPHHEASDGFPLTTLREIHTLKVCCQHPNIVDLMEIAVSDKASSNSAGDARGGVFLVFEYCPTDLANVLDTHDAYQQQHRNNQRKRSRNLNRHSSDSSRVSSPFTQAQVKTLTKQLLSAVDWCHQHFLIHRDIKPSNLLYSTDGTLKLCDFGLSRHCSGKRFNDTSQPPLTPNVVSLWYRAPELLFPNTSAASRPNASTYSFPIDLFSVGCVFCELLQGFPLLDGKSDMEQIGKMADCLGDPPSRWIFYDFQHKRQPSHHGERHTLSLWDRFDYLSTEGLSLATRLLDYEPSERWTASQALRSPYFSTEDPLPATKMPSLRELGIEK